MRSSLVGASPGAYAPARCYTPRMPERSHIARTLATLDSAEGFGVVRFGDDGVLAGRVAVLPSAFNPPTLAHRHLLDSARGVDEVSSAAALLSTRNVDKGLYGAGLDERVGMLLADHVAPPPFAVLATNAARLADQGEALRAAFPRVGFDFVVGYDTLIRLFDARYYTDMAAELGAFFEHHRVIAANRAEATVVQVQEFIGREAVAFASRIVVHEIPPGPAALSSTRARESAAEELIGEVLSPPVAAYISSHGLYGAAPAIEPHESQIVNRNRKS